MFEEIMEVVEQVEPRVMTLYNDSKFEKKFGPWVNVQNVVYT